MPVLNVGLMAEAMRRAAVNIVAHPAKTPTTQLVLEDALSVARRRKLRLKRASQARDLIKALSSREREWLEHTMTGAEAEEIAARMRLHRHSINGLRIRAAKKLNARGVADICRIAHLALTPMTISASD
jgi:two-component system response regulator FixJ